MKRENADERVTLKTFSTVAEAHIVKGKIESFGIECFIPDEQAAAIGLGETDIEVRLQVKRKDLEKALQAVNKPSF